MFCPVCGTLSDRVQEYKTRQLRHFSVGKMEVKEFPMISFRCVNEVSKQQKRKGLSWSSNGYRNLAIKTAYHQYAV